MNNYIGIDVAKSTLQIYIPLNKMDLELENSPDGLKKLYSKLKNKCKSLAKIAVMRTGYPLRVK